MTGARNLPGEGAPIRIAAGLKTLGGVQGYVDNDVTVGVNAEYVLGAAKGAKSLLGVWWGTGVGGGIVLDGKVWEGRGAAAEIGHVVVKIGGAQCTCGRRGCMEAYAGRGAMEIRARRLHDRGRKTDLFKIMEKRGRTRLTSGVWARALEHEDELAIELIERALEALGAGVASAVNLLDVETVVIGGGLGTRLGEPYVERIREAMLPHLFVRGEPAAGGARRAGRPRRRDRRRAAGPPLAAAVRLPRASGLADQVVALGDVRRAPGGLGVRRGRGRQVAAELVQVAADGVPAVALAEHLAQPVGLEQPHGGTDDVADRDRAAEQRGGVLARLGRRRGRRGRRTRRGSAASRSPRRRPRRRAGPRWRPRSGSAPAAETTSADCRTRTPSAISRVSHRLRSWRSSVTMRPSESKSRREASVVEEHQREQPARLGFLGGEGELAGEPDRLVRQVHPARVAGRVDRGRARAARRRGRRAGRGGGRAGRLARAWPG